METPSDPVEAKDNAEKQLRYVAATLFAYSGILNGLHFIARGGGDLGLVLVHQNRIDLNCLRPC
jgi:hypothetical protein